MSRGTGSLWRGNFVYPQSAHGFIRYLRHLAGNRPRGGAQKSFSWVKPYELCHDYILSSLFSYIWWVSPGNGEDHRCLLSAEHRPARAYGHGRTGLRVRIHTFTWVIRLWVGNLSFVGLFDDKEIPVHAEETLSEPRERKVSTMSLLHYINPRL